MADVLPFKRPEPPKCTCEPERWASGRAVCLDCRTTWDAENPVGTYQFECPVCLTERGVWLRPFAPPVGDMIYECAHCPSEYLFATIGPKGPRLLCAGCGCDHTDGVFNG